MTNRTNSPCAAARPRRGGWRRNVASAAAAVALLAAGCGGDGDSPTAADTTEVEAAGEGTASTEAADQPTTTPAGEADGSEIDLAAFCGGAIEGEAQFNAGPELDEAGNPTAEGLDQFAQQLQPALTDLEDNAPEEIEDEVGTVVTAVRDAIEQGDPSGTETLEFLRADQAIDRFVFDNCNLAATQEIVGVEYAFEGLPATMPGGQVGIRLDNQGEEVHEAVIMRINDDVDLSVEELLELPEEEAQQNVEFQGATMAAPGESGVTVLDLEPGRYAVLCFIPVGTTSLDDLESETPPGGPPHFAQGMVSEFEVE